MQLSKEAVIADAVDTPSALVLCDSRLHRLTLYPNDAAIDYVLTTLFLANLSEVSVSSSRIDLATNDP